MPDSAQANTRPNSSENVLHLQQAFKLALSLTLFYWFALWTNWDVLKYGVLAIVIVSLGTTGASVEQALLRVVGTTFGVFCGFLYLALFNHDRIAMMVVFSAHITVIGYIMQSSRYPYAWYVAAFVPLVVWGDNYPHFESAFYFGMFRWFETTVGVLIYTMVDLVLWPRRAGVELAGLGRSYFESASSVITSLRRQLTGEEGTEEAAGVQASVTSVTTQLVGTLRSAYIDTPDVRANKPAWDWWMENAQLLATTLGQCRESVATLRPIKSQRLVRELDAALEKLVGDLKQTTLLWPNTEETLRSDVSADSCPLEPRPFEFEMSTLAELTESDRASANRLADQLRTCRHASYDLTRAARVIVGLDSPEELSSTLSRGESVRHPMWNSTHLMKSFFPPLAFIATYAFWIFWNPPAGSKVPMLAAVISLITLRSSMNPLASWLVMFLSVLLAAAPIYWLVMPGLSTPLELSTLIFLFAFMCRYLGARLPALKSIPIMVFAVVTNISNQQQYLFQAPVDAAFMLLLSGMIVTVVYYLCLPLLPGPSAQSA